MLLLGVFQILLMGFMARAWFSRYLMGAIPFIVLAVGMACVALAERAGRKRAQVTVVVLLLALITTSAVLQDVRLVSEPTEFSWAADDRWQYIEGWSSGYGFNEETKELRQRIKRHQKTVIFVDKNIGYPKDAVELVFSGTKNVEIVLIDETKSLPALLAKNGFGYIAVTGPPRMLEASEFEKQNKEWLKDAVLYKPGKQSSFRIYEYHENSLKALSK